MSAAWGRSVSFLPFFWGSRASTHLFCSAKPSSPEPRRQTSCSIINCSTPIGAQGKIWTHWWVWLLISPFRLCWRFSFFLCQTQCRGKSRKIKPRARSSRRKLSNVDSRRCSSTHKRQILRTEHCKLKRKTRVCFSSSLAPLRFLIPRPLVSFKMLTSSLMKWRCSTQKTWATSMAQLRPTTFNLLIWKINIKKLVSVLLFLRLS